MSYFTILLWPSIFVWPYSCLHPCQIFALFLRYPYPEHSQCNTKVLWSAFFCLPLVPLHGILCHSHSDFNRNLIASSGLWKLICFLWINVTIMFSLLLCYNVLLFMFFGLCFVRFMGHVGALLNSVEMCCLICFMFSLLWLSSMYL